jgi:hypothetical protein
MANTRLTKKAIATMLFTVAACLILSNCYKQYYFPVEIAEITVSPVYRLEIKNDSTQLLIFQPRTGAGENVEEKKISVGDSFTTLLQIKKIKVGDTTTREVVNGPYIDSGRLGADTADLRYKDSRGSRDLVIDLKSDFWFKAYETSGLNEEPRPRILKVNLTDQNLSKPKWFRKGPDHP